MKHMLGEKIYNSRIKKGLTQTQLGDLVGVSNKAVSKWETDEANPDTSLIPKIAKALGVSVSELFGEEVTDFYEHNANTSKKEEVFMENNDNYCVYRRSSREINKKKLLRFFSLGIVIFGLIFLGVGLGMYIGFAVPENRDLRIATDTSNTTYVATVTQANRSNLTMGSENMYAVTFSWNNNSEKTNAIYSKDEAQAMVGQEITIRIKDGRAVPVNYERSGYSILGWVFLGVFGGIGLIAIIAASTLFIVSVNMKEKKQTVNQNF